jgi:hypothetical protein
MGKKENKEKSVERQVGLGIDQKKADIVTFTDKGQERKQIAGYLEGDTQPSGGRDVDSRKDYGENDGQDNRFKGPPDKYYDDYP